MNACFLYSFNNQEKYPNSPFLKLMILFLTLKDNFKNDVKFAVRLSEVILVTQPIISVETKELLNSIQYLK